MSRSSKDRGWALVALVSALMLVTLALSGCGPSGKPAEAAPLRVDGHLIKAGQQRWIAAGAVDYVLPFYTNPGNTAVPSLAAYTSANYDERDRIFATMRRDGVNIVRIPVSATVASSDPYGIGNVTSYIDRILAVVHAAQKAGLRIIICDFDASSQAGTLTSTYSSEFSFMHEVVRAVGDDPEVIYEPYNEPNGLSWKQWLGIMEPTLREWRDVIGYKGVLILDTIGYSWEFSPGPARTLEILDSSLEGGSAQVVFANHRYPDGAHCFCGADLASWKAEIGQWVGRFPIIGTEYGSYVQGFPVNREWVAEIASYIRRVAVPAGDNGFVAFVWSWTDQNSLTTANHVTLNRYGRSIEAAYWRPAQ